MRNATLCAWLMILAAAAAHVLGAEPRGPAFGNNRFSTAIASAGTPPDVDDYVAGLAAGEALSVEVAAAAHSELRPLVRFVDPGGNDVDPDAVVKKGGRLVVARNFTVTSTGTWTVRVRGEAATHGAYTARFRIEPAPRARIAHQRLGGDAPLTAVYAFEAADGATLSLTLDSAPSGAQVTLRSLVDPSGRSVAVPADAVTVRGRQLVVRALPLTGGSGEYRLGLGIDSGHAVWSLVLAADPPPRPRGRTALLADEPYVAPRAVALDGSAGTIARIEGAHFPVHPPFPVVYLGDAVARVAAVATNGTHLDVVVPPGTDGNIVGVTVQNPDGQAASRPGYFRYVALRPLDVLTIEPSRAVLRQSTSRTFVVTLTRPAPPLGMQVALTATGAIGALPSSLSIGGGATSASFQLTASSDVASGRVVATYASSVAAEVTVAPPASIASITPAVAEVLEGATETITVTLDSAAPPAGLDVALAVTGGVGSAPGWVHVPGDALAAAFEFTAAGVRATGTIAASSANTVSAALTVVPPTTIDVSGWRIEQANSARTFTIPSGTVLHEGDYLVVGRNATRAQFETFWGRTLGAEVLYLNGADQWPNINGAETYHLKDAAGASVDGPTIAMASAGGNDCRRRAGLAPANAASWIQVSATPVTNATPGTGQSAAASAPGVYVSEFCDANGSGNYVYEFVELYFDRLP